MNKKSRTDVGSPVAPGVEDFAHFYAREFVPVAALAHVLSGSRAYAEDLAQEAFLAAYRDWDRVAVMDQPGAWVRRVVANRSVSLIRRRLTVIRSLPRLGSQNPGAHAAVMDAAAEEVWEAVRRLSKRQAQAIALHYLEDLSLDDIGGILGCSSATIKTHLHRGRERLATMLAHTTEEVTP